MYGAADFDIFGNIRSGGASNPVGTMMQGTSMTPPPAIGNNVGFNGVANGMGTAGQRLQMPQTGQGQGGFGANSGLGFNLGTGQLVLGGIQAIGNMWAAMEANKLAREQFDFTKGVTNTNLANSIQSYNTSLGDRINSRSFTEGRDQAYTDRYIDENKLRDQR